MTKSSLLEVKVWGDFALFTRPEFSAERVSYEVMTPSAARGVLEAIFWKPEFSWRIHEIVVLKDIRRFSILRNECNSHQSDRVARKWETSKAGSYYAEEDRSQRHSLCLRDVAYIIRADIKLKPHETNSAKYREQFKRRVEKGQCHHQPYFGTREFSAFFEPPDGTEKAIERTDHLGLMLFDVEISEDAKGNIVYFSHSSNGRQLTKGNARPKFFRAQLNKGILSVDERFYEPGVYQCS
jgi:CRISPR-associated protein Cas5d